MKEIRVKEMMIPISQYATVSEEASLYEAVQALADVQKQWNQDMPYKHRSVLVLNTVGLPVGKLSPMDVVLGLEDGYKKIGDLRGVSHSGFSPEFIKLMMQQHQLWQRPLQDLCKKAARVKVGDIMYSLSEGEYVEEDASLDEAAHRLIVGKHQSLLVTKEREITGVLRLDDIFHKVCEEIKLCKV
ncbi:MAG: CBS domain-containing protein [Desulfatiglandales bacterium]